MHHADSFVWVRMTQYHHLSHDGVISMLCLPACVCVSAVQHVKWHYQCKVHGTIALGSKRDTVCQSFSLGMVLSQTPSVSGWRCSLGGITDDHVQDEWL